MARLSILAQLDYASCGDADILLQLEAAMLPEQTVEQAHIDLPATEHFARVAGHDTIGERIWLRTAQDLKVRYEATVAVNRLAGDISGLAATPTHLLPAEAVDYLMPSRYCPSDAFQSLVEDEFGGTLGGARVGAITEWIGKHLTYTPGSSDSSTTALQTYVERHGVCRDFAHLLISMVRASAIPARFASVYGIGVQPQDFHAVAEVFLDNTWYIVDATGMAKAEEIAKIGVGRDAADVSFLTSYGPLNLRSQSVEVSLV